MDRKEQLIFLKGKERTEDISALHYSNGIYSLRFKDSNTAYHYRKEAIKIYKPVSIDLTDCRVLLDGKEFKDISGLWHYSEAGYYYAEKAYGRWLFKDCRIRIRRSLLSSPECSDLIAYLKELSTINKLGYEDGECILRRYYESIDFIDKDSVLAAYITGKSLTRVDDEVIIFPFGCNRSQIEAVRNALSNQISVIQGPPGTGKTQTILTIAANLILRNMTAEIVSNNNSAIQNISDKLDSYGLGFILAPLGRLENVRKFIDSQHDLPDMSRWFSNNNPASAERLINNLTDELYSLYAMQEELQKKKAERDGIRRERTYFERRLSGSEYSFSDDDIPKKIQSAKLLEYMERYRHLVRNGKLTFWGRFLAAFMHRSMFWEFSASPYSDIETYFGWRYYKAKDVELSEEIDRIEEKLRAGNIKDKTQELQKLSMEVLLDNLARRYDEHIPRKQFSEKEIQNHPGEFLREYPIVTSTVFSASSALSGAIFDYVIMDEASQSDIATGALALLNAENAVIVGDSKQLPNVITEDERKEALEIYSRYNPGKQYSYTDSSFLASICMVFPNAPDTLLKEHYRCHPKIIGFCNERFYSGELVIMTEDRNEQDAIELYLAPAGNHSRDHANLRQAEIIKDEILPNLKQIDSSEIGIITPYNNNARLIQQLSGTSIRTSTVHSFQGQEMDTIIYVSSDDTATEFSDNPALINVAVSRAKKKFILIATDNKQPAGSNIASLISYISYCNFMIKRSGIQSVFDLLYSEAEEKRKDYLRRHRRISDFDSENLMYALIEEVLASYPDKQLSIIPHYPLRYLFELNDELTEEETDYMQRDGTHTDFILFRKIGKEPILAIEVDGYHYHKEGTNQYERDRLKDSIFRKYDLPLMRFSTNGSRERERLDAFISGL